jgi:arylsulfatase A-like enzyme
MSPRGVIRSPLIVTGPGVKHNGDTSNTVHVTDIVPTLIDIAGAEHPSKPVARPAVSTQGTFHGRRSLGAHVPITPAACWPNETREQMTTSNQAYKQTSAAGRQAAETAKSIGEDVSDFASDVSRRAGEQLGRAQDMAVDAVDEAHAAIRRNPLLTIAIALGIGFVFGALFRR